MANLVSLALLLALLGGALCRRADATAFEVGGDVGWVVPPASDGGRYNQWASKNRFLVGDSVHFKYNNKEDSVMVVTEDDYNNCRAAHPIFFSNNGDTVVELDRPGLFYFISGVAGHCERGQRMVVKVIGGQGAPPPSPLVPPPAPPSPPHPSGAAATGTSTLAGAIAAAAIALPVVMIGV